MTAKFKIRYYVPNFYYTLTIRFNGLPFNYSPLAIKLMSPGLHFYIVDLRSLSLTPRGLVLRCILVISEND